MFARFLLICALVAGANLALGSPADDAWKAVTDLDAGPGEKAESAAQLQALAVAHLGKQEQALRQFLVGFSDDPRAFEAKLRLARLLQIRSDVEGLPNLGRESRRLLDELRKMASTPEQHAELDFAEITSYMRSLRQPSQRQREQLLAMTRKFQAGHPGDRRLAALLAEVATQFDLAPKTKGELLNEAALLAKDDDLKARIADDLKRVDLFGQPVPLTFTPAVGKPVSLEDHRGKVVVLVFFAVWSQPSTEILDDLQKSITGLGANRSQVQLFGVSLDTRREPLEKLMAAKNITWPVICDGKGWESPLARSFGINELPTVWILDRKGRLRSLDGRVNTISQLRQLLAER